MYFEIWVWTRLRPAVACLLSNKLLFHKTGRKRLPSSILDYLENSHDVLVRQQRRGKTPTKELSTATKKLNLLLSLNLQEDQKRFPILPTWQFLCIPLYQVLLFNLIWMAFWKTDIFRIIIYTHYILIMNASFMRFMKTPKKDNYLSRMFLLHIVMSHKCFLQKNILVQLGYLFDIYYLLGLNFWSAMPLILSFPSRHNFWDNFSTQPKTSVWKAW